MTDEEAARPAERQGQRGIRGRVLDHSTAVVVGLTGLALALRLPELDQALYGDELFTLGNVAGRSLGGVLATVRESWEAEPPAFFVLAWLSAKLGDPTVWIRLPSLVSGVGLVPATFALGRLTVGRGAGLLGAAMVALAPFAVFYSVEARAYALMMLALTASTVCLLRALDGNRPAWWAAYAAASAVTVYAQTVAVGVLGLQAAWAVWARRERLGRLALANLAAAVAFLPWLPTVLDPGKRIALVLFERFTPSAGELAGTLVHLLPGSPLLVPIERLPGLPATLAFAAGAALALGASLVGRHRRPWPSPRAPSGLVLGLVPGGLAALLAISAATGHDLFIPRYASTVFPYLALGLGWLVAASPPALGATAAALIGVALSVAAVDMARTDGERPRYREAARLLESRVRPGDVVLERQLFRTRLFGEPGRLGDHLRIYLPRRVVYLREGVEDGRAWAAARRGGRVFYVHVPGPRTPLPPTLGPDRLAPTRRWLWPGTLAVSVTSYRLPARRGSR